MEEIKKIYFKYLCSKSLIKTDASTKEKKIFFDANLSNDIIEKWNNEYSDNLYNEFMENNISDFHSWNYIICCIILDSYVSFDSVNKILNILNKMDLSEMCKEYSFYFREGCYFLAQFIYDSRKTNVLGPIKYNSKDRYIGILPYLYKNKEYDLFNQLLKKITYIMNHIKYKTFKEELDNFLKENNIK